MQKITAKKTDVSHGPGIPSGWWEWSIELNGVTIANGYESCEETALETARRIVGNECPGCMGDGEVQLDDTGEFVVCDVCNGGKFECPVSGRIIPQEHDGLDGGGRAKP